MTVLNRAKANPWTLKTPPGTSEFTMHVEEKDGTNVLVCTVGKTVLLYDVRCIDDLHAMLTANGDWVELGGADEQKPAKDGSVEAWGRSANNPIGGWYGLKKGLRGRFGVPLRSPRLRVEQWMFCDDKPFRPGLGLRGTRRRS